MDGAAHPVPEVPGGQARQGAKEARGGHRGTAGRWWTAAVVGTPVGGAPHDTEVGVLQVGGDLDGVGGRGRAGQDPQPYAGRAAHHAADHMAALHGGDGGGVDEEFPDLALEVCRQFLGGAPAQQPAAGHDRDVGGDGLHVGDDVRRQQHHAVGGEPAQQVAEADPLLGVEAGGGFVHHDHPGVAQQGLGDADPAQHAAGVGAQRALRGAGQVDQFEQFLDPCPRRAGGEALGGGEVAEELAGGQVRVGPEVLRQVAEMAADGVRGGGEVGALVAEGAAGRAGHRGDDPHQGGLAGAVGAEQAQHAVAEGEGEAVDGAGAAPVDLGDVGQFQHVSHPVSP